jgi:hypothetical protein
MSLVLLTHHTPVCTPYDISVATCQGSNSKSRGEINRTISRTANRRSLSIDRLVKIYNAISSSSTTSSSTSVLLTKGYYLIPPSIVVNARKIVISTPTSRLPLVVNTRQKLSQQLPIPWPPSLQHNYCRPLFLGLITGVPFQHVSVSISYPDRNMCIIH